MKMSSIAVAVLLAACGSKDAAPAAAPGPDSVQVLGAGSEPRQVLRYHVAKGTTNAVDLALDVDIDASGQGGPLPTLVMTSELVAEDVLSDGSTKLRTTITNVTARDRPGGAITAAQMAEQTGLMRGLILRGILGPDGVLRELAVDTGGRVLPPGLISQLDTLSKSFEQVAMPLPRTAVGPGASWLHSKTFTQSGMEMTTTTTFTLTAIAGDTLTFESATLVSGKDQTVNQSGQQIQLSKISGKGSGKGTVDLSNMAMTGELLAELGSDMSAQGESTRMTMKMATRLTPAGSPDPATGSGTAPPPAGSGSGVPPPPAGSGSAVTKPSP